MASLALDKKDLFQVHVAPAVLTPFEEDTEDPVLALDPDVPLPSIEPDNNDSFIFGPPSQSSEGRYTTGTRSSPRRLSNLTQLTEPSSISDMPSETFSLAQHKSKGPVASSTAFSSPAISPTKERQPAPFFSPTTTTTTTAAHHDIPRSTIKPSSWRPHPPRRHHTTETPTRHTPPSSSSSERHRQNPQQPPLILLHITLLPPPPPPLPLHAMPPRLQAQYRLLEAKLADAVLMQRGLLVPHPRDEYDVLEERLLEGLGLVAPRVLKCGHFWGSSANDDIVDHWCPEASSSTTSYARRDSGVEAEHEQEEESVPMAGVEDEDDDDDEDAVCDECRAPVALAEDPARAGPPHSRWSVKIYAANGLMRAGAWAAAWGEMERVDVEIAPWVGARQMRAMRRRLRGEERGRREEEQRAEERRRREVAAAEERARAEAERMAEGRAVVAAKRAEEERLRLIGSAALAAAAERRLAEKRAEERVRDAVRVEKRRVRDEAARKRAEVEAARKDIPLGVLLRKSLYVVATDPRNVLILLLSVLIAFLLGMQEAAAPGLPSMTELDVVSFDMPILIDNSTMAPPPPPLEVIHTSTTTLTAFILETIAPQPPFMDANEKGIPASQPSASPTTTHSSEPTSAPDDAEKEQQLKDAIFAASMQILDSAFEKMAAIVSSQAAAQTEASGTTGAPADNEEGYEEAMIMLVSPDHDGVDQAPELIGEASDDDDDGDNDIKPSTSKSLTAESMVPIDDKDTAAAARAEPAVPAAEQATPPEPMEDVTASASSAGIVEDRRESTATDATSMEIPIHLDDDEERVSMDHAHSAHLFAPAYPGCCSAQDGLSNVAAADGREAREDATTLLHAPQQSPNYHPAADYFDQAPTCPAVVDEDREASSMEVDDEDAAAEAFMESVVLVEEEEEEEEEEEASAIDGVVVVAEAKGESIVERQEASQNIVVEQLDGTELAEAVVQLPKDVESSVEEESVERDGNEEINVVLDV